MSRRIWLDRTIEAAREAQVTMPWARPPLPFPAESAAAVRAAKG